MVSEDGNDDETGRTTEGLADRENHDDEELDSLLSLLGGDDDALEGDDTRSEAEPLSSLADQDSVVSIRDRERQQDNDLAISPVARMPPDRRDETADVDDDYDNNATDHQLVPPLQCWPVSKQNMKSTGLSDPDMAKVAPIPPADEQQKKGGRNKKRGQYRCGYCYALKKDHICPFKEKRRLERRFKHVKTQTDESSLRSGKDQPTTNNDTTGKRSILPSNDPIDPLGQEDTNESIGKKRRKSVQDQKSTGNTDQTNEDDHKDEKDDTNKGAEDEHRNQEE